MNIVNIRAKLADTLNRVAYQGERVVLERRGKGVAALVSMGDLALLEKLEDEADVRAVKAARQESGEIPWEQVKAELAAKRLGLSGKAQTRRARVPKVKG